MLKITKLSNLALKAFKANNNEVVDGSDDKKNETIVNSSKNNKFRKLTYIPNIKAIKKSTFLITNTKKAFNYLKQVFIKALIF